MNFRKYSFYFLLLVLSLSSSSVSWARGKLYKRALVVAGGGISPAVVLGMIDGARAQGWNPDVVLTTCGSSVGAAIANAYPNGFDSLRFAQSDIFHRLLDNIEIVTPKLRGVKDILDDLETSNGIPDLFDSTILQMPNRLRSMGASRFNQGSTRFVMLAARANFGPRDVGAEGKRPSYTQVYFTDSYTAQGLRGMKSTIRRLFPNSYLRYNTEVITGVHPEDAARASVSDPVLLNPALIDGSYYFTGAVNLIPIEEAQALADDVVVTYPGTLFSKEKELVIEKSFGFNPSQRVLSAVQHTNVKWVDATGIDKVSFDPEPFYLTMRIRNDIPKSPEGFARGILKQYNFGYSRVQEGLKLQTSSKNVRSHLRKIVDAK